MSKEVYRHEVYCSNGKACRMHAAQRRTCALLLCVPQTEEQEGS